jgi:hypothetical protein
MPLFIILNIGYVYKHELNKQLLENAEQKLLQHLLLCCVVTYGMVGSNMYYYTKVMSQLFLDTPLSPGDTATFRSLSTMGEFWKVSQFNESIPRFTMQWFNLLLCAFFLLSDWKIELGA